MANSFEDLNKAKSNNKYEYHTRIVDIELEMKHYKKYFKVKIVFF